jgi:hypothetical protein
VNWSREQIAEPRHKNEATLSSVSCTRGACAAVGLYKGGPFVERSHAGRWTIDHAPSPGVRGRSRGAWLSRVSCASARACVAVGFTGLFGVSADGAPLAERFNGRRWVVEPIVVPAQIVHSHHYFGAGLISVSCPSSKACVALGLYQHIGSDGSKAFVPFGERWDGRRWSFDPLPAPSAGVSAGAVSCATASACTIVGDGNTALRWDGAAWTVQQLPSPAGASGVYLRSISCPRTNSCTAVGAMSRQPHRGQTLVEHWNGTQWRVQSSPSPHTLLHPALGDVSCTNPTTCVAVGGYIAIVGSFTEHRP